MDTTSLSTWATRVLRGIGAPTTAQNLAFLTAWANREGGGGAYNPLNTTQRMTGSTSLSGNSAGVQNYTSLDMSVQATVKTLLNGFYGDVVTAFKKNTADVNATYKGLSTWSGSGYSSLSGVSTTGGTVSTTPYKTTSPASAGTIRDQVEAKYGYMAAYLKDPELGPILIKAAQNNWGESELRGALYKTKWWKTHSETTRTWDSQAQMDPATTKAQIAQQVSDLFAQSRNLGLIMDPKRLSQLAVDSLRLGWDGQQIRNALVSEGKFDLTGKTGSAALTLRDNLKAQADNYLVPVDNKTLMQWVGNVSKGDVSQGDFEGYLKEQAKSLFPGMGAAIDSGVTPKQYTAPYASIAANTLEIPPDQVNFMDPKWNKALFQVDPKTGARTSMSLADWGTTLRTDPSYGYDKTQGAKQQAADLTTQLAQTFGAI